MKKIFLLFILTSCFSTYAQIDTDQLSLDISKADAANTEQLKAFIWKKYSVVTVDGEEKLKTTTEFSFDEKGELQSEMIDSESNVKQKRGLRGRFQKSAQDENIDYAQNALDLAIAYTFMSKGQLIDFFDKATVTEKDGIIEVTSKDVFIKGDSLKVEIESSTKLFLSKSFSSFLDKDPVSGSIEYKKFKSGVSHASKSTINMHSKNAVIKSENKDYSQRVE